MRISSLGHCWYCYQNLDFDIETLIIEALVIESLVLVESRVIMNGLTVMGLRVIDDDRLRLVQVRRLVVGQSSVVCVLIEVLVSLHASYVNMVD